MNFLGGATGTVAPGPDLVNNSTAAASQTSTSNSSVSFQAPPGFQASNQQPRGDGRRRREDFAQQMRVVKILADMKIDEKVRLGTQISDFILDCQYGGYECYTRYMHLEEQCTNFSEMSIY